MSGEIIAVWQDEHFGFNPEGAIGCLRHFVTLDFPQLERRTALNFMIMGDPHPRDIIECTDYYEIEPEPPLLPSPEGQDEFL
jgi:hypothetical protein